MYNFVFREKRDELILLFLQTRDIIVPFGAKHIRCRYTGSLLIVLSATRLLEM